MTELDRIAAWLGGSVQEGYWIRVDTGDLTSKENYDDLLSMSSEIEAMCDEYEIDEMWADHDTQIIEFKKVIK